MKKGFTLVELAIVLVIVGLLIGGILVAQSLIGSARIHRLISDLRQYEIATNQFYGKFKQYPGDSTLFTPPGNDNAALSWVGTCAASPNDTLSGAEGLQFWAHLSQAQMLSKNYPVFSDANNCGGTDSDAEKSAPYTLISKTFSTIHWGISPYKNTASSSLYFFFATGPVDAPAVENKLSVQNPTLDGSGDPMGNGSMVVNSREIGNCRSAGLATVACNDSTADVAEFYYFPLVQ